MVCKLIFLKEDSSVCEIVHILIITTFLSAIYWAATKIFHVIYFRLKKILQSWSLYWPNIRMYKGFPSVLFPPFLPFLSSFLLFFPLFLLPSFIPFPLSPSFFPSLFVYYSLLFFFPPFLSPTPFIPQSHEVSLSHLKLKIFFLVLCRHLILLGLQVYY